MKTEDFEHEVATRETISYIQFQVVYFVQKLQSIVQISHLVLKQ